MIFEYRRSLSEAFYSNKLFWATELLAQLLIVVVLYNQYFHNALMLTFAIINIAFEVTLNVLMFKTKDPARGDNLMTSDDLVSGSVTPP